MDTSIDDQAILNDEVWRAWDQKRKLREEKTARKIKIRAGIILALLAVGSAIYLLAIR
jgi:hypothetical protein